MKNIILKYIVLPIIVSGLFGCQSDLLDTRPTDGVSELELWTDGNFVTQAVTGVYSYLMIDYKTNNRWHPCWDVRSQVMDFDVTWVSSLEQLRGNATPKTAEYENFWKRFYEAAHRANKVIANIHQVPDEGLSQKKKAQYTAECKFLRAWFYYRLNSLWRGVPIYEEPIEFVADAKLPRSSEQEVWDFIIKDLTDCIEEPNLPDKYTSSSSDFGRITKGAAYALRGKVYLWMKDYKAAEDDFKAVTTFGYSLFDDYKALFKEINERSDEMIFSIQYIDQKGYGNAKSWAFGNRAAAGAGWNNYIPNPALVDSYEEVDGKPFNWEDYLPNYYTMTLKQRSVYFLRDNLTSKEKETMTNYGADMTKYLPIGNEARIKKAYENRDPRLAQNIITPYSTFSGGVTGAVIDYTLRWPYRGSDTAEPFDLRTDTNSKFYYLIRKFVFEGREHINETYSPIDMPLIRYADILLNLAEALNEQGKTDEAIPYVNMVRERAGVALLNSNEHTTVKSRLDMQERIRRERYWELAFEDHMYFDELRWGTWKLKKFFRGNGLSEIWGTTTYTYSWVGDQNWVWPIPAQEIEMNPLIKQNDGWIN